MSADFFGESIRVPAISLEYVPNGVPASQGRTPSARERVSRWPSAMRFNSNDKLPQSSLAVTSWYSSQERSFKWGGVDSEVSALRHCFRQFGI